MMMVIMTIDNCDVYADVDDDNDDGDDDHDDDDDHDHDHDDDDDDVAALGYLCQPFIAVDEVNG